MGTTLTARALSDRGMRPFTGVRSRVRDHVCPPRRAAQSSRRLTWLGSRAPGSERAGASATRHSPRASIPALSPPPERRLEKRGPRGGGPGGGDPGAGAALLPSRASAHRPCASLKGQEGRNQRAPGPRVGSQGTPSSDFQGIR